MKIQLGVPLVGTALAGLLISPSLSAQTYAVRPGTFAGRAEVASALGDASVGERYCNDAGCVIFTRTPSEKSVLQALASQKLLWLEEISNARKLLFERAVWDADSQTFDRSFTGDSEVAASSPESLFAVVFKSYPEPSWLEQLQDAGLVITEPVPAMGYLVYGKRSALANVAAKAPQIYRTLEIPAGIKRLNLDEPVPADKDGPISTLVAFINVSSSEVNRAMAKASGREPTLEFRMRGIVGYSAELWRDDAIALGSYPEVVSILRNIYLAEPSDERSNRIVAGQWQTPNSAWPPPPLPVNSSNPAYWDGYLSSLAALPGGFSIPNQTIGFLDTGIGAGYQYPLPTPPPACPPHLAYPGPCRLVFTSDVSQAFGTAEQAADQRGHGTLTTSLSAGGLLTPGPIQRDADSYAFTQGLAQGARMAVVKFWANQGCFLPGHPDYAYRSSTEGSFSADDQLQRLRYGLVTMNGRNPLPTEFSGRPAGPGVSIFNHSWNIYCPLPPPHQSDPCEGDYIAGGHLSGLLDQTTRDPGLAWFNFGSDGVYVGMGEPMLHVVSAGNYWGSGSNDVTAPATAKNALTVGATTTANPMTYGYGSCTGSGTDNPYSLPTFSRRSPGPRIKPELVAPGVRAYGLRSAALSGQFGCSLLCNGDLLGSGADPRFGWSEGTSFAAPVAAGAAALIREWHRTLKTAAPWVSPSPAMVKATMIAAARPLASTPTEGSGFGGVSLDSLFREQSASSKHYFFLDQKVILPLQGYTVWEKTLTIKNTSEDVSVALVWTDRYSNTISPPALVNDLDLQVLMTSPTSHFWCGNNFLNGYSIRDSEFHDHTNTAEKVRISAGQLGGVTQITIRVTAWTLVGDAFLQDALPGGPTRVPVYNRQDFALAVINAYDPSAQ